jgi:hypothetical protein
MHIRKEKKKMEEKKKKKHTHKKSNQKEFVAPTSTAPRLDRAL